MDQIKGKAITIIGVNQVWNGFRKFMPAISYMSDLIWLMRRDYESINVYYDRYSNLRLECRHHDGVNRYEVRLLKPAGIIYLHHAAKRTIDTVQERIRNSRYSLRVPKPW